MSTIKVNTLTGTTSAGSIVVTGEGGGETTNLQQGLAKAWGHFDQRGSILGANTTGDTFNLTSITDVEAGHIDVTIANDMVNATYSVNATTHYDGTISNDRFSRFVGASGIATGSFRLAGQYVNNGPEDVYFHGIVVHGDLAE